MIVSQNMVAEAEIMCPKSIPMLDVKYHLCVEQEHSVKVEVSPTSPVPIFAQAACSEIVQDSILETPVIEFVPNVRSGSYAEIGQRESMDDEHIRIDDLAAHLGFVFKYPIPSAFYAVFDGHGGPDAAAFVKRNAMRLFFEDADMLQTYDTDAFFLKKLEDTHRRAFRLADLALAAEQSVSGYCGTTALTALVLGKHLMVANAGDCRAVLCRRGTAVAMSQDHRPSYLPEQRRVEELHGVIVDGYLNGELSVTRALGDWEFKRDTAVEISQDHRPSYMPEQRRVEELGGFIVDGYLNGDLSVACALGDWEFKLPLGIASPLTAEPDVQLVKLTEDDEFLIIGCDGIWDVMTSQVAVSLVRRGLRRHGDPQQCARELVKEALRLNTSDNLTVIVICLSSIQSIVDSCSPRRRRFKACSLSEEARNRLKSEMEWK